MDTNLFNAPPVTREPLGGGSEKSPVSTPGVVTSGQFGKGSPTSVKLGKNCLYDAADSRNIELLGK